MCRLSNNDNNNNTTSKAPTNGRTSNLKRRSSSSSFLLLTHDSFVFPELERVHIDKDDANKRQPNSNSNNSSNNNSRSSNEDGEKNPHIYGLGGPTLHATLATVAFYVLLLFGIEHAAKAMLRRYAVHIIPILNESPHNVGVLARHLSVDFLSLLVCAYVSISNRHVCSEITRHFLASASSWLWGGRGGGGGSASSELKQQQQQDKTATTTTTTMMHDEGYEERIFKYHPGAQRLCTFFLVYQVKNLYDTLYWNDGIEFVLHHIFAGAAAWGGMFPGCCHFYTIFYFGFSEISTAILCLLANFDPKYGIAGLDQAFPKTKLFLGVLFVASFVVCRLILWPYATYFFARDSMRAIRSDGPLVRGRRGYLRAIYGCCVVLTLIQLLFVAMIVQTGKEELGKWMK